LDGTLKLHGITQNISIPVNISYWKSIQLSSDFTIKPQDYKIEIPKIVLDKIADEVRVSVKAELFKNY
jgi:polyisoprenoid-binding protein YceI